MFKVHEVRFSRDFSCFTTCGEDGFRVFNVEPLLQMCHATVEEIGRYLNNIHNLNNIQSSNNLS